MSAGASGPQHLRKIRKPAEDRDWSKLVNEVSVRHSIRHICLCLGVRQQAVYAWRAGEARVPDKYRAALLELSEVPT